MGSLDHLLGKIETQTSSHIRSTTPLTLENVFDLISEAERAWREDGTVQADVLFHQAIEAYRRNEPHNLDFALGRYGAFLLATGRADEAAGVLEEAIKMGTGIGMVWSDYLRILSQRRHLVALFGAVDQMMGVLRGSPVRRTEMLLVYAIQADREGDPNFGEAVARRALEEATAQSEHKARWTAAGVLGKIIEGTGRVGEAVGLWTEAFEEGSNDPMTLNRLSMHFERTKDYARATMILRDGLRRELPADVEEQLRKRLARCEAKLSPGRKRADVPAFSVRHGEGAFELVFQVRMRTPMRAAQIIEPIARCLCVTKGVASFVDLDLVTGAEAHRIEGLSDLDEPHFTPSGWGIGIKRTAPVGAGPTEIWFFDPKGRVTLRAAVPDATSQVALGENLWYVGCRDGRLYAFDFGGRQRWVWETPGSRDFQGNPYIRPCPYSVASGGPLVTVASWNHIYTLSQSGVLLWHHEFSAKHLDQQMLRLSIDKSLATDEDYRVLGAEPGASQKEIKKAYRLAVLATHPDRNPTDPNAGSRFREVQRAYEAIARGVAQEGPVLGLTFQVEGPPPSVSFLGATQNGVVAGYEGRIYLFDITGRVLAIRALGSGGACVALRDDGSPGAAWCDGELFSFQGDKLINTADSPGYPPQLAMFGENVILWRGSRIEVMDTLLQLIWAAEFPRLIKAVATHLDKLICAAGAFSAFRRSG